MKLYYWSPFFSNVATEKAVLNSIQSINPKFSKKKNKSIFIGCYRRMGKSKNLTLLFKILKNMNY